MTIQGRISRGWRERKRYRVGFVVDLAVGEKDGNVEGLLGGRRIVEEGELVYSVADFGRKGEGNRRGVGQVGESL